MTTISLLNLPTDHKEKQQAAFSLINALIEAPNQELRGRTPAASWEIINKFIAEDSYVKTLVVSAEATLLGADKYIQELTHELSIFERRATRNPEIVKQAGNQVDREVIYREIANLIFDAFSSNPLQLAETKNRPKVAESPIKDLIVEPIPHRINNSEESQIQTKSAFDIESELKVEKLINLAENLKNHKLTRFKEHLELAELLFEVESNPTIHEFAELVKQEIGKEGELHLKEISNVTRAALRVDQNKNISFQSLSETLERIRNLAGFGLMFDRRPLMQLTEAGILRPESAKALLENHDLVKSADPVALRLATKMSQNFCITSKNLSNLNQIVENLKDSGKDDLWIEKRLGEPLKMGPAKLSHLINVASLAKWDIDIEPLLSKNTEGEEIIRMAAHGELDVVSQKDSHYKKLLQAGIDSSLRVLKNSKPECRAAILGATKAIRDIAGFELFDIQDILITFANNSKCTNLESRLTELGTALANLSRGACPLEKLRTVAELAPRQYNKNGDEKTIQFLTNLEKLNSAGVRGIDNLIGSCVPVLIRRSQGDETQHFAGFPVEVSTAIRLQDSGYEIVALSTALSSNYQYDIIAKDLQGTLLGIEVKRTLDTLISKNYKSSLNQTDDIVHTQLYKQARSAKIDGITPVVAILYRHEDAWARTPTLHLLDSVKQQLGIKPLVMNRFDCTLIKL